MCRYFCLLCHKAVSQRSGERFGPCIWTRELTCQENSNFQRNQPPQCQGFLSASLALPNMFDSTFLRSSSQIKFHLLPIYITMVSKCSNSKSNGTPGRFNDSTRRCCGKGRNGATRNMKWRVASLHGNTVVEFHWTSIGRQIFLFRKSDPSRDQRKKCFQFL